MITFLGDQFLTKLFHKGHLECRLKAEGFEVCAHPSIPIDSPLSLSKSFLEKSSLILILFQPRHFSTLRDPSKFIDFLKSLFDALFGLGVDANKIAYVFPLKGIDQKLSPLDFAVKDACKLYGIFYALPGNIRIQKVLILRASSKKLKPFVLFLITLCKQFFLTGKLSDLSLSKWVNKND